MLTRRAYLLRLGACLAGLVVLLAISPGIGTQSRMFGWWDAWRAKLGLAIDAGELRGRPFADTDADGRISDDERAGFIEQARFVGFEMRFRRSLLALQVGVTLALSGAVLQVLLGNSLAEPYTLGIAGGGSLGALIAIRAGWVVSWFGISAIAASAFLGGLAVVGVVLALARGARRLTSNETILAGVTVGLFCGAMMMFITAVSSERTVFATVRWMMGSLDPLSGAAETSMLPFLLPAWAVLVLAARALNQFRLGETMAAARGIDTGRLQWVCVLMITLATAAVVARCGPIGFVGLVVPHMAARIVGSDCRVWLPASAMLGGAFLIVCDWASQLAMGLAGTLTGRRLGGAVLPIGVVTALVGVPLFLALLCGRKNRPRPQS